MISGIKTGDIMTRNFISVSPDTNLKICAKTMIKKKVGSLIIKEDSILKGILTEKDIIWAIVKKSKKDLDKILAKDLMKRKVVAIKPSADISDALNKMKKEKVRRLPVVENTKVIGMLTLNDILKIEPSLFEIMSESVRIKERAKFLKTEKIRKKKKVGLCEECGKLGVLSKEDGLMICRACYDAK